MLYFPKKFVPETTGHACDVRFDMILRHALSIVRTSGVEESKLLDMIQLTATRSAMGAIQIGSQISREITDFSSYLNSELKDMRRWKSEPE